MDEDATVAGYAASKTEGADPFETAPPARSDVRCDAPDIADDPGASQEPDIDDAFAKAFGDLVAPREEPQPPATNGHDTGPPWECAAYGLPPEIVEGIHLWSTKDAAKIQQGDDVIFQRYSTRDLKAHHLGMAKMLGLIGTDEEIAEDMGRMIQKISAEYLARWEGKRDAEQKLEYDESGWKLDIPRTLDDLIAILREEREILLDHTVAPVATSSEWPAAITAVADPIAAAYGWSTDAVALQMLGITSACLAASVDLEVTSAHHEYPVLWTCAAAGTGARKTALRSCLELGIRAVEKEMHEETNFAAQEWKEQLADAKSDHEAARKDPVAREAAARRIMEIEARKPAEKIWAFAGEATPESFAQMADKQRAITLMTDEGGTVLGAAGEYADARSRGSKRRQDWARYCALYDGQPLRVMRVGRIHMSHGIFVPMCISTQPDVVTTVMSQALVDESGFLPRWLFVLSPRREPEPPGDEFEKAKQTFERATRWIAQWGFKTHAAAGTRPIPMGTIAEAREAVDRAMQPLKDSVAAGADSTSEIEPFIARFHGHIWRIALVSKFLVGALEGIACEDVAMQPLTHLDIEYALPLARSVMRQLLALKDEATKGTSSDAVANDLALDIARRLLDPGYAQSIETETAGPQRLYVIRKSDPIRRKWRGFNAAEQKRPGAISDALRRLLDLGIVRLAPKTTGRRLGSESFLVNPHFADPSVPRQPGQD